MELIWLHFLTTILGITLGVINLVFEKGTLRHCIFGWCWLILMTCGTVLSFWIREINEGSFSWINLLIVWIIICMVVALISIRKDSSEYTQGL